MVAGGVCDDPARTFLWREGEDGIRCAPDLEGATAKHLRYKAVIQAIMPLGKEHA